MTPEQLASARIEFDTYDEDRDGKISRDELNRVMTRNGLGVAEDQIEDVMRMMGAGNDGTITFEQFVAALSARPVEELELTDDSSDDETGVFTG